jgi:hypothetical protein
MHFFYGKKKKQTLWPSVRKGIIPTERPPLVGEISSFMVRIFKFKFVLLAV